jgi:ribosomal-protein-alanine N-acetyltransferase
MNMPLALERCTIRPWRLDDATSLPKHANDRKVWVGLRDRFPHPYTVDDAKEFLRRTTAEQPSTNFCIEIGGEVSGGIGIRIGSDVHRHVAELGYWLGRAFWGHGIMSETVAAFTDYCFKTFSLNRIHAELYANNPASARVLEKTGFVYEGRLRNNVVKDGQILDSLVYGKTRDHPAFT